MTALKALIQLSRLIEIIEDISPFPLSEDEWNRTCEAGSWLFDQLSPEEKKMNDKIGKMKQHNNLENDKFKRKLEEEFSLIFN